MGTIRAWIKSTNVTTSSSDIVGTGTISQSGTTITGSGTAFNSQVVAGDLITATGISAIVTSVNNDTSLTVDTSTTSGSNLSFTISPQATTARITAYADQSGTGNGLTVPTNKCILKPNQVNGLPSIYTGPSSCGLTFTSGLNFSNDRATFYLVIRVNLSNGRNIYFASTTNRIGIGCSNQRPTINNNTGQSVQSVGDVSTYKVFGAVWDGSNVTFRINGSAESPQAFNPDITQTNTGPFLDNTTAKGMFDLVEFLALSTALSQAQVEVLENYFKYRTKLF